MKYYKYLVPLMVTSALTVATAFGAGGGASDGAGSSGGAGDHNSIARFAWFTGDKVVRYCIRQSADFGTDEATARSAVQTALATWHDYIKFKNIDGYNFYGNPEHVEPAGNPIPNNPAHPKFTALETKELTSCDGSQDVEFRLGGNSHVKVIDNESTFAAAVMTSHDSKANQSKGFIWLVSQKNAPKYVHWKDKNVLIGVLMHEIGHALGCGHAERTIMDRDLSKYLDGYYSATPNTDFLRTIDFFYQLIPRNFTGNRQEDYLKVCDDETVKSAYYPESFVGLNTNNAAVGQDNMKEIAKLLLGRPMTGTNLYIKFTNYCGQLQVRDAGGSVTLKMKLQIYYFGGMDEDLFALANGFSSQDRYLHQRQDTVPGILTSPDGRVVQILFNINHGLAPITLRLDQRDSGAWGSDIMRSATPFDQDQLPPPEDD